MYRSIYVGADLDDLREAVTPETWDIWSRREPALAATTFDGFLAASAQEADQALGALLRLAAVDNGDDTLAARLVLARLGGNVGFLFRRFGPACGWREEVVAAFFWERIRTFPWRTRTHHFQSNVVFDCWSALRRGLYDARDVVPIDPQHGFDYVPQTPAREEPADELAALLAWGHQAGLVRPDEIQLLGELVDAGWELIDQECGQQKRGAATETAMWVLADRRGCSMRTVQRQVASVIGRLRRHRDVYLGLVA
jgi:hypothetical protein